MPADERKELERLREKNRELENRCRLLQDAVKMQGHFADLANVLSTAVELPELAAAFLDKLISITGIRAGALYLSSKTGTEALTTRGFSLEGEAPVPAQVAEAVLSGDMVIAEGPEAGRLLGSGEQDGTLAAFPCLYEEDANSVILVADPGPISIEAMSFISALGPNVALAINNALSYNKIREATRALNNEKNKLNAVIRNMTDGLIVTAPDNTVALSNPAVEKLFGLESGSLMGRNTLEVFPGAGIGEMVADVMTGHGAEILQTDLKLDKRVIRAVSSVIKTGSELLGVITVFRDITKEWEVDRMKTDFISTVSHELRTPLTSVIGFARLIKKKLEDTVFPQINSTDKKVVKAVRQVGENINVIVSEGERLTSLINDVLDIAKMEAGKIEWKKDLVSLEEVIERATTATVSLFEAKGLALIKRIEPDLPKIVGDKDRLIQVMINLISNAVKFTDRGSITCSAERGNDRITVSVRDTGMGIAEEDLPKVFEKFKQVGDTLTDKPTGTGLGLPICKEIIEHHAGTIRAESRPGEGSVFSFVLPVGETAASTIDLLMRHLQEHTDEGRPAEVNGRKRVLVVDDEEHIREYLRQVIEENGYEVVLARDGFEAIAEIRKQRPDIITLDVMMPGISGFDVAAVLKNNPLTRDIPIIILSIIEDHERGYRLGIDRYHTKPVDTEELLKSIAVLLSHGHSRKKVLVIDEDVATVKTLSDVLDAKGFQITGAFTGEDGIDKAIETKPDMVIVDSGLSERHNIVSTLRFERGMEHVLFIVMSGDADSDKIEKTKKLMGLS
ncbi:MAG: response regulator [Nitrospiraceae bacterium]|nr:response regulator [Nitrospiraceae bacterium]